MRGQKRPHAGAVAIGRARSDKPDIVAEQLIVTHGGNGREHILGRSAVGGGGAAFPAVVVILEVIPRANATARLLGIVIVLDAQPVAHAVLLVLLFATEQATQATLLRLGARRSRSRDGLERLCARGDGHGGRDRCRCGFGALRRRKGIVCPRRRIGKIEQRRAGRDVGLLHRRQRRIGDRGQRRRRGRRSGGRIGDIHLLARRHLRRNLRHEGVNRLVLRGSDIGHRGAGVARRGHGKDLRRIRPGHIRLGSLVNRRGLLLHRRILDLLGRAGLNGIGLVDNRIIGGVLGIIGDGKGLGNCSALLLKRHRGIK